MANHALDAFLNDPDPAARRAEFLAFVGPRSEGFLHLYDYLVRHPESESTNRLGSGLAYNGFSAPAFFLGPVYFFYRKMWLWGTGYVIGLLALAAYPLTSRVDIGLGIAMALFTRWAYVHHAIRTITTLRSKASEIAPDDRQRFLDTLAQAGGVSWTAGWISGVLFALALALAVMQTLG
ncbi:Protein of unknown function [Granulicella pectinivorans]|jgi:hypothetical protein|uniref:DUF2628 domain-containing protein n=1 Tax=Granulicella pectinivorans TaxID=474950 RepID=A0A1I6LLL6_9BACT|nr:DUF2628 domain-containing protein [Granulicella pectinivorans]SFS04289.1 Protein of unknown function [Granulicella pectinivorans]